MGNSQLAIEEPLRGERRMRRLVAAVLDLSLARDVESVRAIVRKAARALSESDGATFVLRDGDKCFYVDEDAIAPLWKGQRFPMTACISGWVMLHREAAAIEDIYADPRIPADAYRPTFVRSLVMVPIRKEAPIGAIGIYWAQSHRATEDEIEALQALADTTSVALENVQLYQSLEQRVRDRTAQLEAANRELEAFAYSVSHDLRAPLRSIDGFSEALQEDCGDRLDDAAKGHLQRIRQSTKRMGELIEALLGLSRINRAPLQRQSVDLSALAKAIADDLQRSDPQRQVTFVIEKDLSANADPDLLRVVLDNLLRNAWKYTSRHPAARIEVGRETGTDPAVYFVRDDGAGFDPRYADRLFGAFQRLHGQAEFPGTGVGLATVQRIIHRHGGEIRAAAEVEKGATFSFTLPPES